MIMVVVLLLVVFCGGCFIRVAIGPTLLDRIAAADSISIMLTIIFVLLGLVFERTIFLDVAIVYSLLLFADILIFAKYLEREDLTK